MSYLGWSALSSDDSVCNSRLERDANGDLLPPSRSSIELWVGLVISAFAIARSASSLSGGMHKVTGGDDDEETEKINRAEEEAEKMDEAADEEKPEAAELKDAHREEEAAEAERLANKGIFHFHLVMALASCYFAMLLTNWGSGKNIGETGSTSYWVKICSQWLVFALYLWTILAPRFCTSREFWV
eukprot:GABV01002199.1.p1 GENE.GABV01002199.1~~GABV01002199.1.p1  ORF type:complete len:186 (-),score=61.71 GABV01002199.1:21-578(-)